MRCGAEQLGTQLAAMVLRLRQKLQQREEPVSPDETLMLRLSEQYPGDVGVFAPIMLNYLQLEPGQAVFLAANEPHAYLSGDAVECMACSDNVVRAGLTSKPRDVDTLCEMLTYRCYDPQQLLVEPRIHGQTTEYSPPCDEFVVARIDLPSPADPCSTDPCFADHSHSGGAKATGAECLVPQTSPALLLVTDGAVVLTTEAGLLTATAGEALLELPLRARCAHPEQVPPAPTTLRAVDGAPATVFRAFAKTCFGT
jgi:mannose-6-phosphate isomerase